MLDESRVNDVGLVEESLAAGGGPRLSDGGLEELAGEIG